MSERRYTEEHEWILVDGGVGTVGISEHAQEQLGDIVFVELPQQGTALEQGGQAATVESVKAASEVYAPASGRVVEANAALADDPGLVNSDPLGKGWFFKLEIRDAAELDKLMDEQAYAKYLETQ